MFDGDILCRAALYPKFINPEGVFDEEILLNFMNVKGTELYAMSVASKLLCRSENGVHDYGCKAAEGANDRFTRDNGRAPKPVTEEVHYLGFYEMTYGALTTLSMDHYEVRCYWKPENGLDMHFQAEFAPSGSGSRKERRRDRQAAVGVLADRTFGPKRHIAKKDEPYRAALEAIDLRPLPKPRQSSGNH